jgi:hypothetical protein
MTIPLPPFPHDLSVQPPTSPFSPPNGENILDVVRYCKDVDASNGKLLCRVLQTQLTSFSGTPSGGAKCTQGDCVNTIVHEHAVISQVVASITPQGKVLIHYMLKCTNICCS